MVYKKIRKLFILTIVSLCISPCLKSQDISVEKRSFTLAEAISCASHFSPEAKAAEHSYRAAYWNYRSYKANYLPTVSLVSNPYLNRQINKVTQPDGTELFLRQNQLITDLGINISQNLSLTGGNFFIQTSAKRIDEFSGNSKSYNTQPFSIGYRQSIFGYNNLKWDRRIEPVKFREACKSYAETLELIASKTCNLFYTLAYAQTNLDIARSNYASADTLYRYARGRYDIGNITENEMLQLEVNKLNEETNMMNAKIEVEDAMLTLRSFLGITDDVEIEVIPSDSISSFEVPLDKAMELAFQNSPEIEMHERKLLESRSQLAAARASRGLKADLYVQFGLSQTADRFNESYRNPLDQQYISLSVAIPILDWGRGKGKVRVAKSQIDLVETQVAQATTDFELNVRKMVRQFNLQARQVDVARKTNITAGKRYDVAMKLYILGKSSILDLNAAIAEKDSAMRNYISAMQTYWSLYYGLRSMTQYDFQKNCPLWHNLELEF